MKRIILIFGLIIGCYSCKNGNRTADKDLPNAIKKDAVLMALDKELDSLYNTGVFNGFTGTIVDSTGIVYNKGFGYADIKTKQPYTENTIINIASVSKMFIGVALAKAVELELLDLDDPINNHLPFTVSNPNYPGTEITIRQLATHTSSISDSEVYLESCYANKDDVAITEALERYTTYYQNPSSHYMSLAEYMPKILTQGGEFYTAQTFANRKPGERFEYSNVGAALCGLIIEYAAKQSFNDFTKAHIFEPLGMTATSWFFEEVDMDKYSKLYYDELELPYYNILSYPDGGLISSSTDLGYFLVDLIQGFSGSGKLLSASGYQEIFTSQLEASAFEKKKAYNVGLFTEKQLAYDVIGHSGGDPGTNTMLFFNTETKRGRIFIANTDSKKENSNDVFWGIWNTLEK